jgi:predicted dehydrogenase/threonine dehydrogenase-like Zn-dependent dehydrogenase
MKQLLQNYKTGELELAEVPIPAVKSGGVLVRNLNSLVSAGTEKLMINLAKKSLMGKAKSRPDLVQKVIKKIKSDGLIEAYKQAMGRLDNPIPLGYSCAGVVEEVGKGASEFKIGDRVACFGSEYAPHAEIVSVPKNLTVKIPDTISYEEASFVGLGAIALHAVRCAEVNLGENVAIIGLGLLGLIAIQLLEASGGNVFGMDFKEDRLKLAEELGAKGTWKPDEDVEGRINQFTEGNGTDSVIIFASTDSNQPIEQASEIARKRARIVVPGKVGLEIPRKIFYEKELNLVVSRSTGPGVYDEEYESKGIDYPISYVRWTEKRNMKQFLEMVSNKKVNLKKLITHRFKIDEALNAYDMILKEKEPFVGVLLEYGEKSDKKLSSTIKIKKEGKKKESKAVVKIGMIGAGQFTKGTLLPAIRKVKIPYDLIGVATASGHSGKHVAKKFGFQYCTTDYKEILNDKDINLVLITTKHGLHAKFVIESLKAGKDVFVEKPLCLDEQELNEIIKIYNKVGKERLLAVGFNRVFSPYTKFIKEQFGETDEPLVINCRVNAGYVPKDSWLNDPEEGGGRIIGEVCHFVDLIQHLSDSLIEEVYALSISGGVNSALEKDNLAINFKMRNGSVGNIIYVANGDKSFSRERVEIFGKGSVGVINNFKSASFTRSSKTKEKKSFITIDRGHTGEMESLFKVVKEGKNFPVSFEEYVNSTLTTFKIEESLKTGKPVKIEFKNKKNW